MTPPQGFSPPPAFASARPLVFGHRGGSKIGPENTRLALTRGMAAGADGFECDVRLAADGVPVLIHTAEPRTARWVRQLATLEVKAL